MGSEYGNGLARRVGKLAPVFMGLLVAVSGFAQQLPKSIRPSNLMDEAMKTAQGVQDPTDRARAFFGIAKALMPIEKRRGCEALKGAIQTAKQMDDPYGRVMMFYEAAMLLVETDKAWAKRVIREALQMVKQMGSFEKAVATRMLVQPLAKIDTRQALSVARGIAEPLQKGMAIGYVAAELVKRNFNEAMTLAESIADPYNKVLALTFMGRGAQDKRQAASAFTKALKIAKGMKAALKDIALRVIAEQMAHREPERALQVAQGIGTPLHKAWALSAVAKMMAGRKDCARALQVLEEALKAAAKEQNPNSQVIALRPIATEMSKLNKQRALRLFDRQIQIAKTLDERQQAAILNFVVADLASLDPKKAQALAAGISRGFEREMALGVVAEAWATRNVQQAVQIARKIKDASLRAMALARIAAKMGNGQFGGSGEPPSDMPR